VTQLRKENKLVLSNKVQRRSAPKLTGVVTRDWLWRASLRDILYDNDEQVGDSA